MPIGRMGYCSKCGKTFPMSTDNSTSLKSFPLKQMAGEDLFDKVRPGVVELETECSRGSGFLISNNLILTCAHCVYDENMNLVSKIKISFENDTFFGSVRIVGDDHRHSLQQIDLAVIEFKPSPSLKSRVLKFADYSTVKNGQTIYALGNALGMGICITKGIVSDRLRKAPDGRTHMLIDCNAFHGNSGCPIFNDDGDVIAILDMGFDDYDNGVNYAVPGCEAVTFLKKAGIM